MVKLRPGKPEQQKNQLSDSIARDVMEVLNYGEESVSVAIEGVASQDWKGKVFDPDIKGKRERLYKKPGYKY